MKNRNKSFKTNTDYFKFIKKDNIKINYVKIKNTKICLNYSYML